MPSNEKCGGASSVRVKLCVAMWEWSTRHNTGERGNNHSVAVLSPCVVTGYPLNCFPHNKGTVGREGGREGRGSGEAS